MAYNPFDIFDEMDQMMGSMFGRAPGQRQRRNPMQPAIGFPGMPHMPSMMSSMMMMPMVSQMSMMGSGMNMGMSIMGNAPGSTMSFSSTSISYDGSGTPNVVQSTSNVRVGSNGVREEQQTYQNSHTGEQRMRLGRHIQQRGHVMDQSRNRYTGQRRENVEYIGINEDEVQDFNQEWTAQMERSGGQCIRSNLAIQDGHNSHSRRQARPQQAITQGVEIIELSDEEDSNNHDNGHTSEPVVDFPDSEPAGQRRHIPDGEQGSPNSSNSEGSERRNRNPLHHLSKPFKSKKLRK